MAPYLAPQAAKSDLSARRPLTDRLVNRVGRRGLEPLTPCASCKCATNCANGPSRGPITALRLALHEQGVPHGRGTMVRPFSHRERRWTRHPTDQVVADRRTLDDATVATHADRVRTDGWTVVEDAIDLDLVDAIADDLLRLERDLGIVPADNLFEGRRTTRIYNLLVHGPLYQRIPVHPNVLPIVEKVLDPGLLISSLSSIAIGPDETAQPIHSDDQLIPLPKPHPPLICNTMWAITDFTEANGATRLCPGTHLADHSPNLLEHYDSIAAEMPKGSVLVWVGSLWHGGGANTTDRAPSGHRHELLRRLRPPAGEPTARHPVETVRQFPDACRSCAATRSTTGSSATSTSSIPGSCSSAPTRTLPRVGLRHPGT